MRKSNILYKPGCVVVLGIEHDYPIFGQIEDIYVVDSNIVYIRVKSLVTLSFNSHYHAYFVNTTRNFSTICLSLLYNVFPLALRKIFTDGNYHHCVVVKHHIIVGSLQI